MAAKRPAEPGQPPNIPNKSRRVEESIGGKSDPVLEWCPFKAELCPFHAEHDGHWAVAFELEAQKPLNVSKSTPKAFRQWNFTRAPLEEPILCVNPRLLQRDEDFQPVDDLHFQRDNNIKHAKSLQNGMLLQQELPPQQMVLPVEYPVAEISTTKLSPKHINNVTKTVTAQSLEIPVARKSANAIAAGHSNIDTNNTLPGDIPNTKLPTIEQYIEQTVEHSIAIAPAAKPRAADADKEESTSFSCDFCNKAFKLKSSKLRHEKSFHVEGAGTKFPCPLCDLSFPRNDGLLGHARKVHGVNLPHIKHHRSAAAVLQPGRLVEKDHEPPGAAP
ncbi:hypothetical protein HDK77DRAFT_431214 [Phyllosticta capitalensis]|uniref:uncharacterized protein n=1 Tax=Phyllosticta capitalensis TaxID=121624 RepID=UPI00313291C3